MTKRDKVIKGLECCLGDTRADLPNLCTICPYAHGSYATQTCGKKLREDALALLKAQEAVVMAGTELDESELIEKIRKAPIFMKPIVDAVPVVHARWQSVSPFVDTEECSNCRYNIQSEELETPYCPWCGAKMDGERSLAFANQSGAEYADNPTV